MLAPSRFRALGVTLATAGAEREEDQMARLSAYRK